MKIIIFGKLPSLNEYTSELTKFGKAGKMKRECQEMIKWFIPKREAFTKRVILHFKFYEQNLKRDIDNISATAHKFIQDALVEVGVLKNDSQRYIKGETDEFYVDRQNPRIEVEIEETDEDVNNSKSFRKLS